MRRVAAILSGFDNVCKKPKGNPHSNSLVGKLTTVLCLDDYHLLDRTGRKEKGITALSPLAQDFGLMYEQVRMSGEQDRKARISYSQHVQHGSEACFAEVRSASGLLRTTALFSRPARATTVNLET